MCGHVHLNPEAYTQNMEAGEEVELVETFEDYKPLSQ
jgi:hypothetical protein